MDRSLFLPISPPRQRQHGMGRPCAPMWSRASARWETERGAELKFLKGLCVLFVSWIFFFLTEASFASWIGDLDWS
ncbi:hypothetical protein GQ55_5G423600 [Panicum hallii var. hallii]|uniref:Uncharacterized protein n=1 Tax=Panicum hallii var. hallii TaxID=1504633 RepID=A0A2T7DP34_9POAL|nr:hypothetical protein GQ55_5G423600 [Panicum hallii var. hallii]